MRTIMTRRAFALGAFACGTSAAMAAPGSSRKDKPSNAPSRTATARPRFTALDSEATHVAGVPNARFGADDLARYAEALGTDPALVQDPWLVISGGGENGAFGAGLLTGWSEAGARPTFSVVTGLSTGALIAPFVFAGAHWDERLKQLYTSVSAADIFEFGATPESLLDTWPLGRMIDREVTAKLLADIAVQHRRGRRLFVVTTNVDTGRPICWNMGAIAASGDPAAEKLFQDVLLASSSIPGIFPPVYLEVETPHGQIGEMHVDGGVTTPFFLAPEPILAGEKVYALPARQVYVVVNNQLSADFEVTPRMLLSILGRSLSAAVKSGTRAAIAAHRAFAQRAGFDLKFATIGSSFSETASGPFDNRYMAKLFAHGALLGRSGAGFGGQGSSRIATAP